MLLHSEILHREIGNRLGFFAQKTERVGNLRE